MSNQDVTLMAHLLRRAGFGATRDELEAYQEKGYEATVEELLHPGDPVSRRPVRAATTGQRRSLLDVPHDHNPQPS